MSRQKIIVTESKPRDTIKAKNMPSGTFGLVANSEYNKKNFADNIDRLVYMPVYARSTSEMYINFPITDTHAPRDGCYGDMDIELAKEVNISMIF